ncbi:MAG: hypothetical protein OEY11_12645 [Gammaproteobacteria bacterium]|nr:hypothetical protein [Gammaproteobacteria bacterium]
MERIKLARGEIILNQAIQWSIYGSNGQLLLRQGSVISKQEVIDKIFLHDPLRNAEMILNQTLNNASSHSHLAKLPPHVIENPFNEITRFSTRYRNLIRDVEKGDAIVSQRVMRLAADIQALVAFDEDACLGAIHFYYDQTYTSLQPIYKAILCELTATLLDYNATQRQSLLAAAITSNIGLTGIQEQLNKQSVPLSEQQQKIILNAPAKAVEMLKQCGIDDSAWLKTLIENHERNDGNGYPWGLKSKHIGVFAKILGLADTYVAMITKRAYRKAALAQSALKEIYQMSSKEDEIIYLNFIRQLGAYPPGTMVKLANNEIAVVIYRGFGNSIMSSAMSIADANGKYYGNPIKRDTSLEEFKVSKIHIPTTKPDLNPDALWSYK